MTATAHHNGILGGDFDEKALDHTQALHEYVQAAVRKGRANAFGEIEAIREKAYAQGFEAGRKHELVGAEFDKQMAKVAALPAENRSHAMTAGFREIYGGEEALKGVAESFVSATEVKSAQAQRDEIVERAKADVVDLIHDYELTADTTKLVVNAEKRTVVVYQVHISSGYLRRRGIAKCVTNDCFNAHIGKAIALHRALGLTVPDEYLTAPNPTEVRVGDVVGYPFDRFDNDRDVVTAIGDEEVYVLGGIPFSSIDELFEVDTVDPDCDPYIIDDSHETEAVD